MLMDFHMKNGEVVTIDLNCHKVESTGEGWITCTNAEDPHVIKIQVGEVAWTAVHPNYRRQRIDPFDAPLPRRLDPRGKQLPL